jgi:hypothetical protein
MTTEITNRDQNLPSKLSSFMLTSILELEFVNYE